MAKAKPLLVESHVEDAALHWFSECGYQIAFGPSIEPDSETPERASYGDILLERRLKSAIERLNPGLTEDIRDEVFRRLLNAESPSQVLENRRLHRYLIEGVPVAVQRARKDHLGRQQERQRML